MVEMTIIGVRVELPQNAPIVLLKERDGERFLPIWIGAAEATAIAVAMQGQTPPRPMTHDLFKDVLEELGVHLDKIEVNALKEGTFFALLHLRRNGTSHAISSRPSDAIALAVRTSVPIYVAEEVLEEAAVLIKDDDEEEVERFKQFLDEVTPEDFVGGEGPGAGPEGSES